MTTTTTSVYDNELLVAYTICPFCLQKNYLTIEDEPGWCMHVKSRKFLGRDNGNNNLTWEVNYDDHSTAIDLDFLGEYYASVERIDKENNND